MRHAGQRVTADALKAYDARRDVLPFTIYNGASMTLREAAN